MVPDRLDHNVDPTDEGRHPPGDEELWGESYYLDFTAAGGEIAGYTRLGVYPNLGVTWWTTAIVGQDRPLVSSIDHHLPLATEPGVSDRRVVAVSSNELSVEYINKDPLRTMSVRGRAPARTLENAIDVYADRAGVPTSLELDLTWRTDGVPYHYDVTTRYEIPCLVTGEIRVDGDVIPIDGQGQRDHSWGVRDWWAFGWCWAAARLDDGTRVHWAHIRLPDGPVALGYVQREGSVDPVEGVAVQEALGPEDVPTRAAARVEPGGIRLDIEPRWFAPALLVAPDGRVSRFPRACARFWSDDGRSGTGWIEWNQPESQPTAP